MPERPPYYFAYGSNLHPLRLGLRTPSARLIEPASLGGHVLRFHKRSDADGSAKANAWASGAAGDHILGVVYALSPAEFGELDAVEGLGNGGYELATAAVALAGGETEAVFFYRAGRSHIDNERYPWRWYRDLVWQGAQWHGMPADYVQSIRDIPAVTDPQSVRREEHAALLAAMPQWRPEDGYRRP